MGFDENVEMIRLAFYQVLISSGPFLGAALAIGLIIGIVQAATSIQGNDLKLCTKNCNCNFCNWFSCKFSFSEFNRLF